MKLALEPLAAVASVVLLASCSGGGAAPSSSTGSTSSASSSTAASSSSGGTGGAGGQSATGSGGGAGGSTSIPGWTLVWSDEFDGPDGSAVDPTKWAYGGPQDGQYNQELEYYNPTTDNVFVAGGNLHLVAKALPAGGAGLTCWNGACQYTSGKIQSKAPGQPSLYAKQFGRFSARMKIPAGQGVWPAFWMLGSNDDTATWPVCGEIDAMENIGKDPATTYGTVHGPNASNQNAQLGGSNVLGSGALADDFHVFAVEWKMGSVTFLIDEAPYFTATPALFQAQGGTWVFDDHAFYMILNLAIGGGWPGSPDANTTFPMEVLVDWVRVYDAAP